MGEAARNAAHGEHVAGMPQWQEYPAMLRRRFAGLDTRRLNLTAEENASPSSNADATGFAAGAGSAAGRLADGVSH